eukprot:scaffold84822_cov32-Phaeocystis_antarctica.AAC.2
MARHLPRAPCPAQHACKPRRTHLPTSPAHPHTAHQNSPRTCGHQVTEDRAPSTEHRAPSTEER